MQVRILGCLVEKERTTPDSYPLTMNSLLAACNQTTNRHPVVSLGEPTVANALANLRAGNLVRIDYSRSNRAERYRHVLGEALGLDAPALAVLAVLMLRGPQTPAELRARAERLHPFADQREVDEVLARLAAGAEPLAARLAPAPGQKEARWAQALCADLAAEAAGGGDAAPRQGRSERAERLEALEAAVATLTAQVERLQAQHDALATLVHDLVD